MASRITVAEMLQALEKTGLVPAHLLENLRRDLREGPREQEALADLLLARGWLTPFQAQRLLQGQLVLGSYVVLEGLGEGGMGEIFKARHLHLDRLVALKVIRRDLEHNPEMVSRFQREIKLAAC